MHFIDCVCQCICWIGLSLMLLGFGVAAISGAAWMVYHLILEIKESISDRESD